MDKIKIDNNSFPRILCAFKSFCHKNNINEQKNKIKLMRYNKKNR